MDTDDIEIVANITLDSNEDDCEIIHSSGSELSLVEVPSDSEQNPKNQLADQQQDISQQDDPSELVPLWVVKLKLHAARKIIRKSKKTQKRNNLFVKSDKASHLESLSKKDSQINDPQEPNTHPQQTNKSQSTSKLEEKTTQKISKVISSGKLTVHRLTKTKTEQEPLVIRKKVKADELIESKSESSSVQTFPKAIVYPDAKNLRNQPTKHVETKRGSYNEVFTEETVRKIQNRYETETRKEATKSPCEPESSSSSSSKPFKYLIPQDLVAAKDDTRATQNSSKVNQLQSRKSDESQTLMPERPKINYDLIDALADYRVIARYLFNRLNIPPMDFDGTDDYINLYKLTRN